MNATSNIVKEAGRIDYIIRKFQPKSANGKSPISPGLINGNRRSSSAVQLIYNVAFGGTSRGDLPLRENTEPPITFRELTIFHCYWPTSQVCRNAMTKRTAQNSNGKVTEFTKNKNFCAGSFLVTQFHPQRAP